MNSAQPRILTAVDNVGQQDIDPPVFLLSTEVSNLTIPSKHSNHTLSGIRIQRLELLYEKAKWIFTCSYT